MAKWLAAAGGATLIALAAQAAAKDRPKENTAEPVRALEACRQIAEPGARLACYDGASARLAQAMERREVVVLDRQEIRETRRSLFGFSVPNIPLFRGEGGKDSGELETTIAGASPIGGGKWQVRLEDGAIWQTSEARLGLSDPRPGQKIVIKRGTLGNYFLRFNGQRGIRGRRIA